MTDLRLDVVVAGAGLTGQVLALSLHGARGADLRVGVVATGSNRDVDTEDIRAFAISAAARNALAAIGVWDEVASQAQPVTGIDITDAKLESPVRPVFLHYDNVLDAGEPASFILEARVLRRAVSAALAGAKSQLATLSGPVVGLESGRHVITIRLAEGTVAARLAVVAEGRGTPLLALAGIRTVEWSYPQSAIVTAVRHERPHGGRAVQHFLQAGPFAILPLPGGHRSSLVWSEERDKARCIMGLNDAAFDAALGQRFGGILGDVHVEGPRALWPLSMHLARSLIGSRLALVGDAARSVHPIAGQGLNIGLRDVAALAEIIVDAQRLGLDIGSHEPLQRYERWRRFDSVVSGMTMDGLNRLFSNDNAVLRTVRDLGLGMVDRSPALKELLVREAAGLTGEVPRLLRGEAL